MSHTHTHTHTYTHTLTTVPAHRNIWHCFGPKRDFSAKSSFLLSVKPDLKVTLKFGMCHLSKFYACFWLPCCETCSYCTLVLVRLRRGESEEGFGAVRLDGSECERWRFQFVTGHRDRNSWRLCRGCSCRRNLLYFTNVPVAGCATLNCKHMWAATLSTVSDVFSVSLSDYLNQQQILYILWKHLYVICLEFIFYVLYTIYVWFKLCIFALFGIWTFLLHYL